MKVANQLILKYGGYLGDFSNLTHVITLITGGLKMEEGTRGGGQSNEEDLTCCCWV